MSDRGDFCIITRQFFAINPGPGEKNCCKLSRPLCVGEVRIYCCTDKICSFGAMASPPVGRRPPGLGRGRGRGNAAANFGRPVPVGRGRGTKASAHTAPSPGTPPVSDRVPDPSSALAKGVHEEITGTCTTESA